MLYYTLLKEKDEKEHYDENAYNEFLYSKIAKDNLQPSQYPLHITDTTVFRVVYEGKEYRLVKHLIFIGRGRDVTLYVLEC